MDRKQKFTAGVRLGFHTQVANPALALNKQKNWVSPNFYLFSRWKWYMCFRQAGCTATSFTLYKLEILQHTKSYNPATLGKSYEGILGNIMLREDIHRHFHPAQISKSVLVQWFVCDSTAFSSGKKKQQQSHSSLPELRFPNIGSCGWNADYPEEILTKANVINYNYTLHNIRSFTANAALAMRTGMSFESHYV